MNAWTFRWDAPISMIVAALLAIAAIELVRRESSGLPRRRRVLLVGLRVLTALLVVMFVGQPTLTGETFERIAGRLAVLVDTSRSMTVQDEGATRAEVAAELLKRWDDAGGSHIASTFAFGARVRASELGEMATRFRALDDESRLVSSVRELTEDDAAGDLGAVVVVSDGAATDASDIEASAASLAALGMRVHAVAIGGEELVDDAIAAVETDAITFLRQPSRVRVRVRARGTGTSSIPVTLRRGDEVEREVIADVSSGEALVDLPFTPRNLGRAVYRLSIPLAPGDAVPENNERAFLVRVTRDKLRVLLVAGRPSWDVRFLRSFLKRDPAIDLISFFILRSSSDLTMASGDELALIPFPTDELFREHLGSFDVVLFQNFDYAPYQMGSHLPRIRDYVRRGGGFAMIGGDRSFASGGYAETPIADVLPVEVPPSSTPETVSIVPGRFRPQLVSVLARHPLVELLPDRAQNARAWAELAPLEGANLVTRVRNDAQVLLVHDHARAADGTALPVLVVGQAAQGRVLALTSDTSFRWGITTGGATGDASAYERFWDRALRYLSKDPSLEPARVTTDRERYGAGARIRIDALLRDARYEPLSGAALRLSLADANGREITGADARADGEGNAHAELGAPEAPGAYVVRAKRADSDETLAEEWLVVESGGDELAQPDARPDILRAIAEATGGTFVESPSSAPLLASFDTTRARSTGTRDIAPFATPWAMMVLAAAFLGEWAVRRAFGKR